MNAVDVESDAPLSADTSARSQAPASTDNASGVDDIAVPDAVAALDDIALPDAVGVPDAVIAVPDAVVVLDPVLAAAVDLARAAATEVAGEPIGEHVGIQADAELVATHGFAAELPGYVGWYWAVTIVRAADSDRVTVDEVVLLPSSDALLAPVWVPWNKRIRPGDLSPGDLVPTEPDDPRLVPAYVLSDDPAVERVGFELGLGRARVMSREGRLDTAERWHAGTGGPDTPMAKQAPAHCATCGFYLPLAGSLQAAFGACGNEVSASDGQVVSVEHGCGAHSEAVVEVPALSEPTGEVFDDGEEIQPA